MWEEEWVQRYLPNWIIGCSRPAIQITTHRLYWIIVSNVLHKRFSSIRVVRVSLIIFALFLIGHSVDLFYTIKLFLFFPLFFLLLHKTTNTQTEFIVYSWQKLYVEMPFTIVLPSKRIFFFVITSRKRFAVCKTGQKMKIIFKLKLASQNCLKPFCINWPGKWRRKKIFFYKTVGPMVNAQNFTLKKIGW